MSRWEPPRTARSRRFYDIHLVVHGTRSPLREANTHARTTVSTLRPLRRHHRAARTLRRRTRLRWPLTPRPAYESWPPGQVLGAAHQPGRPPAQPRTRLLAPRHPGRGPREVRPQSGRPAARGTGDRPQADGPHLRGGAGEGHRGAPGRLEGRQQAGGTVAGDAARLRHAEARRAARAPDHDVGRDGSPAPDLEREAGDGASGPAPGSRR